MVTRGTRRLRRAAISTAACAAMLTVAPAGVGWAAATVPTTVPSTVPTTAGGHLAFVRHGDIYVSDTGGGHAVQLTHVGDAQLPRWSPDGRIIAFTRVHRRDGRESIWFIDADGSHLRYFRPGFGASWSPDGTRMALVIDYRVKTPCQPWNTTEIVVPIARPYHQSCFSSWNDNPDAPTDWSPDGRYFLTNEPNGAGGSYNGNNIVRFTLGDKSSTELISTSCFMDTCTPKLWPDQGRYSPDGRSIVFQGSMGLSGNGHAYVMAADGSRPHRVSPDAHVSFPAFMRSGDSVLYTQTLPGEAPVIRRVDITGHHPVTVLTDASQADQQPLHLR